MPAESLPRRILMTADAVGGVWQYTLDLCAALAAAGVEVLVATLGPPPKAEQVSSLEAIPGVRTVHGEYGLEWMPNRWQEVDASGRWLLELNDSFQADVVHLNGFSHAVLPWERPVLCVAHSCVRSWWRAVEGGDPGSDRDEYTGRVRAGLDACTAIVAPSETMARSVAEEYGVARSKIRVIHNSSRTPEYSRKQKEAFVLAAGRAWDKAKNFKLLEDIAPMLDWPLRIAGAGNMESSADRVQWLGVLDQAKLSDQMQRASILAHPALYEPFGLVPLEAAHARCCLVLGDIPSLRELWSGAAVFLDPRDPELWVFEMNQLMSDFPRRQRLSDQAAKRAQRYSFEAMATEYLQLYTSLMIADEKGVAA